MDAAVIGSRPRRMRVRARPYFVALVLTLAAGATACGGPDTPTPTPATAQPISSPSGPPAPTEPPAARLRIAIDGALEGGFANAASGGDAVRLSGFLYDGLYGLDEDLRPVPRLAAGPAVVSADGRTWTLTLRDDVRFHDGQLLTADDVVHTYERAMSPRCGFSSGNCLSAILAGTARVDDRTVAFTLREPQASFAATALRLAIESKAAVDASYERFLAGIGGVTASETSSYLGLVAAEEARPTGPPGPDGDPTVAYGPFRVAGEALLTRAAVDLPVPGLHTADGDFDEGSYVRDVVARVRAVDATFTSLRLDAMAAAYPYLDLQDAPLGTGPFVLAAEGVGAETGGALSLIANKAYFLGAPEIDRVEVRIAGSDVAATRAVLDGGVDWRPTVRPATYDAMRDDPAARFVEYPEFGFLGLYFNLHPEADGLFLDRRLRQAVAYCFDTQTTTASATDGHGLAIFSEIPVMSWAHPPSGLATYPMDADRAIGLIEAAGWTRGDDDIYVKDGRRLSTTVAVREGFPARAAWLRLVADQVRSCGIDFQVAEASFASILDMLVVYPHVNAAAPEDGRPFDAYFGGFDTGIDPDPFRFYHSSECSSTERPDTYNFGCYQSETVDRLIDAGRVEADQAKRAEIYHEYAVQLSEDLPVIYAWSDLLREAISPTLGTTADRGLELDTPTWYRQLERLTNVR